MARIETVSAQTLTSHKLGPMLNSLFELRGQIESSPAYVPVLNRLIPDYGGRTGSTIYGPEIHPRKDRFRVPNRCSKGLKGPHIERVG